MKIVLIGPGAIGCLIAAFISRVHKDIWLLDKNDARASEIQKKGIRIEGVSGEWKTEVNITTTPSEIGKADLIIICTKSYDTECAIRRGKELLDHHTHVLSLQNGIGNIEIISKYIDKEKIICGVTGLGSTVIGYGHIRHAGMGRTIIGSPTGMNKEFLQRVVDLFIKAGLPTEISDDIESVLWSKLMINACINPVTAITGLKNGLLIEYRETRDLMQMILSEVLRIMKAKNIDLLYKDPYETIISVCRDTADNMSSMLQDMINKRPTEIEFINGVVVKEGKRLDIPTPVNESILYLVKALEMTYLTQKI